jgi:hypothetical protein
MHRLSTMQTTTLETLQTHANIVPLSCGTEVCHNKSTQAVHDRGSDRHCVLQVALQRKPAIPRQGAMQKGATTMFADAARRIRAGYTSRCG